MTSQRKSALDHGAPTAASPSRRLQAGPAKQITYLTFVTFAMILSLHDALSALEVTPPCGRQQVQRAHRALSRRYRPNEDTPPAAAPRYRRMRKAYRAINEDTPLYGTSLNAARRPSRITAPAFIDAGIISPRPELARKNTAPRQNEDDEEPTEDFSFLPVVVAGGARVVYTWFEPLRHLMWSSVFRAILGLLLEYAQCLFLVDAFFAVGFAFFGEDLLDRDRLLERLDAPWDDFRLNWTAIDQMRVAATAPWRVVGNAMKPSDKY